VVSPLTDTARHVQLGGEVIDDLSSNPQRGLIQTDPSLWVLFYVGRSVKQAKTGT
jgi:hypothetical protein